MRFGIRPPLVAGLLLAALELVLFVLAPALLSAVLLPAERQSLTQEGVTTQVLKLCCG